MSATVSRSPHLPAELREAERLLLRHTAGRWPSGGGPGACVWERVGGRGEAGERDDERELCFLSLPQRMFPIGREEPAQSPGAGAGSQLPR